MKWSGSVVTIELRIGGVEWISGGVRVAHVYCGVGDGWHDSYRRR